MQLSTTKMLAEKDGAIGWMIFNNPERHNALSLEMQEAIPAILDTFNADDEVRVVVMRGAGERAFVSGADISEFESRRSSAGDVQSYNEVGGRSGAAYRRLTKPLIAMIRGYAMGGGLLTALNAEIRICSDDAQLGIPAAKLGLGYGFGGTKTLVDLVGPAYAAEILFTGARFSAAEALQMGLVNRVVPAADLERTVRSLAQTICENAPLTVRALKATIHEATKERSERNYELVEQLTAACFASEDYVEGRRAFMEKRAPNFRGR